MDENESDLQDEEVKPRTHDRWTVLALAFDWAAQVASISSDTLLVAAKATIQHGWQREYDRKFTKMTEDL